VTERKREGKGAGLGWGERMGRLHVWAEGERERGTGRIAAGPSRPKPERGKGFAPSFVFFF